MNYSLDAVKLRKKMAEAGIPSLQQLSRLSSIHRNTLYPLARGERSPFSEPFLSICKTLKADPISLVTKEADQEQPLVYEIVSNVCEQFQRQHSMLVLFLFGSRARGDAKRFSDYDLGITGGKLPVSGQLFLQIREAILENGDDLPVKLDILNFDAAPASFLLDFEGPLKLIAGSVESLAYLEGKIDGYRCEAKI